MVYLCKKERGRRSLDLFLLDGSPEQKLLRILALGQGDEIYVLFVSGLLYWDVYKIPSPCVIHTMYAQEGAPTSQNSSLRAFINLIITNIIAITIDIMHQSTPTQQNGQEPGSLPEFSAAQISSPRQRPRRCPFSRGDLSAFISFDFDHHHGMWNYTNRQNTD